MTTAAQLAAQLERASPAEGMKLVEASNLKALHFDIVDDAMCIMHPDGSVNVIEMVSGGRVAVEVISAENILRVLKHYRPFPEVFKKKVQ